MIRALPIAAAFALALLVPAGAGAQRDNGSFDACVAETTRSLKMSGLAATVKLLCGNVHQVRRMEAHSACVLKGIAQVADHRGFMALQGDCAKASRGTP